MEWTRASFEQSLAELYTILLEEHIFLTLVSKTHQNCSMMFKFVIVLAGEDVEVHLRAIRTMNEQFQLCEWGHCSLGKLHHCSEIT
jgi:hypothetical protein